MAPEARSLEDEPFCPPGIITSSWSYEDNKGAHVLPPLPYIASNYDRAANYDPRLGFVPVLEWFDAETGVEGVGAIPLVSHVRDISLDEAAWCLAKFATFSFGVEFDYFLMKQK